MIDIAKISGIMPAEFTLLVAVTLLVAITLRAAADGEIVSLGSAESRRGDEP